MKALNAAKHDVLARLRRHHGKLAKDAESDADEIVGGLTLDEIGRLASIESDLSDVAGDTGRMFLVQLNVAAPDDLFGQVNDRAVAFARERAAELVSGVTDATRDELRSLIAGGLDENLDMDAIASRIEAAYAFSEERADLIAQTEIARANQAGALEGMFTAREAGLSIKKVWLPDDEACDDCLTNGDDGPIDLDDTFTSGDDAPPAHPNCRCTMASEIEEAGESDDAEEGDEE